MKKLIRWLADISGVSSDIEKETAVGIGYRMHDAGYWLSDFPNEMKIIQSYSEHLINKQLGLFGGQFERWRSNLYKNKTNG